MIELYPFQKKALNELKTGSVLVGGVGSGKSITSLAYFYNKVCQGDFYTKSLPLKPKNLFIITTALKRDSLEWDNEFLKFGLSKDENVSVCKIKVTVDSWNNVSKYIDVTDSFFIFDEQRVVGSGTWVKSFLKIVKNNDWILLSATPGDTWSDYIPVFIANGFYKNRTEFLKRHAVFSRFSKYPKIERYVDTARLDRLRKLILVNMDFDRPTTRRVIDMDVSYNKELYDKAMVDRWDPFKEEPIKDASQLCYILRKIVNSDTSRLDTLVRLSYFHERLIVFYNLDCELEQLRKIKDSVVDGTSIAEWNGHKHEKIPTTDRWVYLVQYTAGSEGWNCIETDTIIFYSLNYSYKIMEQASGRIDRVNTPFKDLYYYRFISKASIDKSILRALKNKKKFNENNFGFIFSSN